MLRTLALTNYSVSTPSFVAALIEQLAVLLRLRALRIAGQPDQSAS